NVVAAQAAVYAIAGHLQVIHRGHACAAAVGERHMAHGNVALQYAAVLAAKVREPDAGHCIVVVEQAEHGVDGAAASAVVLFQVPASRPGSAVDGGLAPPEAD